jgi:hypothetical protein
MRFAANVAPDFLWDLNGAEQPRPSKDHRRGFSLYLYVTGIGIRELCANSRGLCDAIVDLFNAYKHDPHARDGLLPVIQTGASQPAEGPDGPYFMPSAKIVGWTSRPPELPVRKAAAPPAAPSGAPPQGTLSAVRGAAGDLDDDIPFATSDPAFEPALAKRAIL